MKDDILTDLTDRMVALKAEKPREGRTKGDIHRDMVQNVFLINQHLKNNYQGIPQAKEWIKENDKFIKELLTRG